MFSWRLEGLGNESTVQVEGMLSVNGDCKEVLFASLEEITKK